jgi:hypothetical protein
MNSLEVIPKDANKERIPGERSFIHLDRVVVAMVVYGQVQT